MARFLIKLSLIILCLPLSLYAQESDSTAKSFVVIDGIELLGNKVTVDKILWREITIRPGDTIDFSHYQEHLIQSKENLMNTSLFNFVDIIETTLDSGGLKHSVVQVKVLERWYIWPLPIFELAERNFSTWWQTKDLDKINYGLFLNWENFRGRKEQLKILLQFGYDEKIGFGYSIPYIDKKQTVGLSFGFNQTKNHSVSYITENNQVQRVKLPDEYGQIAYNGYISLSHRPDIYQSHQVELSYNDRFFDDTIFQLNPLFYQGEDHRAQYLKLSYFFKNDHRDYKTYPLKGYYFDMLIEKHGMGFFKGSGIHLFVAKANIRKFWKMNRRFYFASGFTGRMGNKDSHPYFISTGLGYGRDFVRGYEFYVVDGQDYGLIKTDLKFAIIPQQVLTLKFIPTDKFNKIPWAIYLSLFGDAAFAPGNGANGNTLQNELLIGYGLGLNLVTYYDVVFRVEYSFNRMGESGLFIHFVASI